MEIVQALQILLQAVGKAPTNVESAQPILQAAQVVQEHANELAKAQQEAPKPKAKPKK